MIHYNLQLPLVSLLLGNSSTSFAFSTLFTFSLELFGELLLNLLPLKCAHLVHGESQRLCPCLLAVVSFSLGI